MRDFIAGVAAPLGPGRKKIPRQPIIEVAERAIEACLDRSVRAFSDRVGGWLELERIPPPGDTVLREICKPIYDRVIAQKQAKPTG